MANDTFDTTVGPVDKWGIPLANIKSSEFCWGGSDVGGIIALYISTSLAFPIVFLAITGFYLPIKKFIADKFDSKEVGAILEIVKGTSFFYLVITYQDIVNYLCQIPPGGFQSAISNGPIQECINLACFRVDHIIQANNFTGLDAEYYCQLCAICGQTGGPAKYYFIALIFVEAFFGFTLFVLCNDLYTWEARIIIWAACWINGLMWMVGVEFFRCRQFSVLPEIENATCLINDITIPGRVFAILYFFLGFLMVFIMLIGDEVDCKMCHERYWYILQKEHMEEKNHGEHTLGSNQISGKDVSKEVADAMKEEIKL